MSLDIRGRNPMGRKIPSDRFSYRANPYRRDLHRTFSQSNTCKNCKTWSFCSRLSQCLNLPQLCLPGHIVSECSTKSLCWNCREPGHMANSCTNEGICHSCGIAGHQEKDCTARQLPPGDFILCNNCYKQGHSQPISLMRKPATTAGRREYTLPWLDRFIQHQLPHFRSCLRTLQLLHSAKEY